MRTSNAPKALCFHPLPALRLGLRILCESLKCPASLMVSYTSSVAVGFEVLSGNLKCPTSLMFSHISSAEGPLCVYGALWCVPFSSVVVGCGVLCSRELCCGAMHCVYTTTVTQHEGPKRPQ